MAVVSCACFSRVGGLAESIDHHFYLLNFLLFLFPGHGFVLWDCGEQPVSKYSVHLVLVLKLDVFFPLCALFSRYGLFYDENEDPMDALKAASQPKEAAKVSKAADAKMQAGKPAEVKGKAAAAGAPASAGVKKAAGGPKEAQSAGQKTAVDGQNKPREGKRNFVFVF